MDDKNLFNKLKNIIEINNYIKDYISLINDKKNILEIIFQRNFFFRRSLSYFRNIKLQIKDNTIFHLGENVSLKILI